MNPTVPPQGEPLITFLLSRVRAGIASVDPNDPQFSTVERAYEHAGAARGLTQALQFVVSRPLDVPLPQSEVSG